MAEKKAVDIAAGFDALSDPVRLRLFDLIARQPNGQVCACDCATPLGKSQPTISHHLKVLYEAGLVERERQGTWIWYRVVPERTSELMRFLVNGRSM